MYESFYHIQRKPFQLNPDPSFFFPSKQHSRAKDYLEYGMHQKEGFIVITGEVGAGKTTIVRGLLDSLDPDKVLAANIANTQVDADDTLRLVAAAFGVPVRDLEKSEILMALEAFLINETSHGKRCLLIVDEAQNLSQRAVEELRMLSNFQYGNHALLQSFLIGQPEFRDILQSPRMEQLRQRVIATCHIGPLDVDELRGYIDHRLKCAGAKGSPQFSADVFPAIYKATGGIPRRINMLCERLLLSGFLNNRARFTAADVNDVVQELRDEIGTPRVVAPVPNDVVASIPAVERSRAPVHVRGEPEAAAERDSEHRKVVPDWAEDLEGRLLQLERAITRLERISTSNLALLQEIHMEVQIMKDGQKPASVRTARSRISDKMERAR